MNLEKLRKTIRNLPQSVSWLICENACLLEKDLERDRKFTNTKKNPVSDFNKQWSVLFNDENETGLQQATRKNLFCSSVPLMRRNYFDWADTFLISWQWLRKTRNSPPFTEPAGSLLCVDKATPLPKGDDLTCNRHPNYPFSTSIP
jgi:hypothetical protein